MTKQTMILVTIIVGVLALVGGGMSGFAVGYNKGAMKNINTFEECTAAGYPVQESYPERCTVPGGGTFTKVVEQGQPAIFKGKVICLLHKDTEGPQTKECAAGLQTDEGKYYTLDASQIDTSLTGKAGSDQRIWIGGMLKNEMSDKYQSEGVITVTDYEFVQ